MPVLGTGRPLRRLRAQERLQHRHHPVDPARPQVDAVTREPTAVAGAHAHPVGKLDPLRVAPGGARTSAASDPDPPPSSRGVTSTSRRRLPRMPNARRTSACVIDPVRPQRDDHHPRQRAGAAALLEQIEPLAHLATAARVDLEPHAREPVGRARASPSRRRRAARGRARACGGRRRAARRRRPAPSRARGRAPPPRSLRCARSREDRA